MASPNTIPMISPDGRLGDVPEEGVSDAVKAGFKVGQDMLSPDGKPGVIPLDQVHPAILKGFQLKGRNPSTPQVQMNKTGILSNAPITSDMEAQTEKLSHQEADRAARAFPLMAGGGLQTVGEEATGALPLLKSFYAKLKGMFEAAPAAAEAPEAAESALSAADEVSHTGAGDQPDVNEIPQDEWDAGHDIDRNVENTPKPKPKTVPEGQKLAAEKGFLDHIGASKEDVATARSKGAVAYQKFLTKAAQQGKEFGPRGGPTEELAAGARAASEKAYLKHLGIDKFTYEEAKSVSRQSAMEHAKKAAQQMLSDAESAGEK